MKYQRGQVLLITIMLMATVITVLMTAVFKSITETQTSHLEQQDQQALAAAQAGLEQALNSKLQSGNQYLSGFSGISAGSSVTVSGKSSNTFVTPLLQPDQQYTFYIADYNKITNQFSNSYNKVVTIYNKSETDCPAVEIAIVKSDNTLVRHLMDPCDLVTKNAGSALTTDDKSILVETTTFQYTSQIDLNDVVVRDSKLLIVRVLGAATKIGFESASSIDIFRSQGTVATSQATTRGGVTKIVQLFQSNPQIPAEFYVTSF